jgi:hypothetical protein
MSDAMLAAAVLPPGRYFYARRVAAEPRVIHRNGQRFTVFIRYIEEDWTTRDGSGRSRETPAPRRSRPPLTAPRGSAPARRAHGRWSAITSPSWRAQT